MTGSSGDTNSRKSLRGTDKIEFMQHFPWNYYKCVEQGTLSKYSRDKAFIPADLLQIYLKDTLDSLVSGTKNIYDAIVQNA